MVASGPLKVHGAAWVPVVIAVVLPGSWQEKNKKAHMRFWATSLDLALTNPTLLPLQSVLSSGNFQEESKDHLSKLELVISHMVAVFMPGTGPKLMAITQTCQPDYPLFIS